MTQSLKGVWRLQEVRDNSLSGAWVYNFEKCDPGTLWNWGSRVFGILGDNAVGSSTSSPVQLPGCWIMTRAGECNLTAGIKSDGTLWTWGENTCGALGDNTVIHRSSPVQVPGTTWRCLSTGIRSIAALKTDGTLWTWGYGTTSGQLGVGDNGISRSSPIQIPGNQWCLVNSSSSTVHAIKTDGTLWGWGDNSRGQLGDNTGTTRSSPVQIPGNQWCFVKSNGSNATRTTLAMKTDNTLWVWGKNYTGGLGINVSYPSCTRSSSPLQIPGQWTTGSITVNNGAAVKTDGTLWVWGDNSSGNLGQNNVIHRSSPTQVPGAWLDIDTAQAVMVARKNDTSLWGWGGNMEVFTGTNKVGFCSGSSPNQVSGRWSDIVTNGIMFSARKGI